jgi:hypothetical protein
MCLLSVRLDTLGLLLRVWLWISVPMAMIILCVGTWMNYLRTARSKGSFRLAVEGLGRDVEFSSGMEGHRADELGNVERVDTSDRDEVTATGRETIYQGILWMKEKYEQYREQADLRYELLREKLGRSERRYQELLVTMEQSQNQVLGTETNSRPETVVHGMVAEAEEAGGEDKAIPDVKQGIIEDLETQLRSERLKVDELVRKLQANSELILRIYKELESIPDLGK